MTDSYRGSSVADGTLTSAGVASKNATGGVETTKATTITGANTWFEILSLAGTFATVTGVTAPDGKGWCYKFTSAMTIPAGNWSAVFNYHGNTSVTTTFEIRFYKNSGGVYTSIGTITLSSQSVTTTKTQYTFAATAMGAVSFANGDYLYWDMWGNDSNTTTATIYESTTSTSGVVSDVEVTTPVAVTVNTRTIPATAAFIATNTRTIPATAALIGTLTRTIPATAALIGTLTRTIPATAALASQRTIPATAALLQTNTRTIPATAALLATSTRTIPASVSLSAQRTIPATASLLALSSLSVSISGILVNIEVDTLSIPDRTDEITQCSFTLGDKTGATYTKGQRVILTDTLLGRLFYGEIDTADPLNLVPDPNIWWAITCVDSHAIPARRTTNKSYTNQSAGSIAAGMYQDVLAAEGVLANVEVALTTTQADWNTGTLTTVVAGSVGDGNLELAGSGTNAGATFNSAAQWNTGTYFNTQNNGADLSLIGVTRNWNDGVHTGQSLFGNGSPTDGVSAGIYQLSCTKLNETRSEFVFAGTWTAGILEYDFYLGGDVPAEGPVWLTTGWINADNSYGYAVEIKTAQLEVRVGLNGSAGSSTSLGVHTFSPKLGVGWYRVRVVFGGGSHSVYLNGTLYLTVSDSTWTSAGYVGHRNRNLEPSITVTNQVDNFGIMKATTGTWTSPATSINTITSIASTGISWDTSGSTGGTILVQTSTDGGSTFQTATNGGTISGLTKGSSGSGKSVVIKVTLSTTSTGVMPDIKNLQWFVNGGYQASGTRVSPAIDLSSAVRAGSTFIGWNAISPVSTSLGVDISIGNTSSWVDVSANNGGPIPGIYTQPDPSVDLFTVDTSANYTSDAVTLSGGVVVSWVYDIANSRVTTSGGFRSLFLYNALSRADVDLYMDMDQAITFGLVWRAVDNNNLYCLMANDDANGNNFTLRKFVAGNPTDIGPYAISFPRGTYRRMRVTMIGGLISMYFDGVLIATYTDGSPLAAGRVGFFSSGSGRAYQLWTQPQGDPLAGVMVYTRQRLATSDVTVTPQVLDLTVTAFDPSIGNGALVPQANYLSTYVDANLDDLAKKSDYAWKIDKNLALKFKGRQAVPSPWILSSNDPLIRDLLVTYGGDLYSNRQVLTGVVDVKAFNDTKIGDGKATSWALSFPLAAAPTITLNNAPVTVGVKGIDTGKAFYWQAGDPTIYQDAAGTLLVSTDSLLIAGLGNYTTRVTRDNLAAQAAYQALQTSGTGIVENVSDVSALGLNIAAAQAYGDALNARYGKTGRTVTFSTIKTGLAPGQLIPAFVPQRSMINVPMLITSVITTVRVISIGSGSVNLRYDFLVVATELVNTGSWQKQLVAAMQ